MRQVDASIPASFADPVMVRNHDVGILGFIREDGEQRLVSAGPLVWSDRDGRGALIAFDLGDGDLTVAEVVRAVGTLIQRPGHFGLDARPVGRIIETYEYSGVTPGCARYPHPDHVAVNEALRRHDFGARAQLSSTCSLDPAARTTLMAQVSDRSAVAALGPNGAFSRWYRWLGNWKLSRNETKHFRQNQAFVVKDEASP